MGWLDRYKQQPKDQTQLDLFGEGQALTPYHRVDGATVQQELQSEVKQRGGTGKTHAQVNAIVTRNVLDCDPADLYAETGGVPNDRASLPEEAQSALIVGDVAARYQMQRDDAQGHKQILDSANKGAKIARKLFPW
ncbi:hypothetical protein H6F87_26215 [Cyanobacteria bacterium FACHB-502]|nr:hypothetical protein [Cyanobacteria bacterium FACHB-502]